MDARGCDNCRSRGEHCDLIVRNGATKRKRKLGDLLSELLSAESDPLLTEAIPEEALILLAADVPQVNEDNIHFVNLHLLKEKYGFNADLRQSPRVYIASNFTVEGAIQGRVAEEKPLQAEHVHQVNFLFASHAFTISTPGLFELCQADLEALFHIFFYKCNSIFPFVEENDFWGLYTRDKLPTIIQMAIVLVICRDELALPIMERSFVNNKPFDENMMRLIRTLDLKIRQLALFLPEIGDHNKLNFLIIHCLLALNLRPSKAGVEQCAQDILKAFLYGQSVVIHLDITHMDLVRRGFVVWSNYFKGIWWSLVALDRMYCLVLGKQVKMNRFDFDVEKPVHLPHLMDLLGTAYDLENTIESIFRPPNADAEAPKDSNYDPVEICHRELLVLLNSSYLQELLAIIKDVEDPPPYLPHISMKQYRSRYLFYLTRMLNIFNLLVVRSYSRPPKHPIERYLVVLLESFLYIHKLTKGKMNHQLLFEFPAVPLIGMALMQASYTTIPRTLRHLVKNDPPITDPGPKIEKANKLLKEYVKELMVFRRSWWNVAEVMKGLKKLYIFSGKRRKQHNKVSTDSLVGGDEIVLPTFSCLSSPTHQAEALRREDDALERDVLSLDDPEYRQAHHLAGNSHTEKTQEKLGAEELYDADEFLEFVVEELQLEPSVSDFLDDLWAENVET